MCARMRWHDTTWIVNPPRCTMYDDRTLTRLTKHFDKMVVCIVYYVTGERERAVEWDAVLSTLEYGVLPNVFCVCWLWMCRCCRTIVFGRFFKRKLVKSVCARLIRIRMMIGGTGHRACHRARARESFVGSKGMRRCVKRLSPYLALPLLILYSLSQAICHFASEHQTRQPFVHSPFQSPLYSGNSIKIHFCIFCRLQSIHKLNTIVCRRKLLLNWKI